MSLNFGFGLYDKKENRKDWDAKYEKIKSNKTFRTFYQVELCYVMMVTDIATVTEKLIPILINRWRTVAEEWYNATMKKLGAKDASSAEEVLKQFIGYQINAITLCTSEFIKKRTKMLKNQLIQLTQAEIEAGRKEEFIS